MNKVKQYLDDKAQGKARHLIVSMLIRKFGMGIAEAGKVSLKWMTYQEIL